MFNQDRHFSAKFQIFKEGEFAAWVPALAIGASDPLSGTDEGYREQSTEGAVSGVFNRYYVAITKHFDTKIGKVGAHIGYQYNRRRVMGYNSPAAAIDWKPVWVTNMDRAVLSNVDVIAEYDGRTLNVGCITSFWNNHFDLMLELSALKYFQAGLRFKYVIKS